MALAPIRPPTRPNPLALALASMHGGLPQRAVPQVRPALQPAHPALPGIAAQRPGTVNPALFVNGAQRAQQAQQGPAINPYTGQPLSANEYVGVAGSEAQHPGMTRIPPPGWWDPSNPNYERRNYYITPDGQIVAAEAGYQPDAAHPYATGRTGEVNQELLTRGGANWVHMSEPGITDWGPGQQNPNLQNGQIDGKVAPAPPPSGGAPRYPLTGANQPQLPAVPGQSPAPSGDAATVLASRGLPPVVVQTSFGRHPRYVMARAVRRSRRGNERNRALGGRAT